MAAEWKKADRSKLTTTWEDASIGFVCDECGDEIITDSESEPKHCECGRMYRYVVQLQVRDAERAD